MTSPTGVADLVSQVLADAPVAFGAVHRDRLADFTARLSHRLASVPAPALDLDSVVRGAAADLLEELGVLAGRALVTAFHEHRRHLGLPPDPGHDAAWTSFDRLVTDGVVATDLALRYPVLTRLLDEAVEARLRLLGEVADAAASDWPALTALGLAPGGVLTRIAVSSGDAHNGGRRVAVVHTEHGRLAYKPRSLAIDAILADAVALLQPHLEPGCELRLPRSLTRAGHGWQEWVDAAPMTEPEQVRRHRYRLGAFLALFAALGSTDLHHENVISAGEHPLFIDLETALQHAPGTESDGPVAMITSPLLATMLLPMRMAGQSVDVDMSGMGTVGAQTCTLASFAVRDPRSDAVRFERTSFEIRHGDNLAHLGDVPVPTTVGADDLLLGFHDALAALRAEREPLVGLFGREVVDVRQVVRPTHVYARFLACSTHPDYLVDEAERTRLFTRLQPARGVAAVAQEGLRDLEVAALERHDVPYFEVSLTGRDLVAPLDGVTGPAYDVALADRLAGAVDDFLATPPAQLEHTVRMCLATAQERLALDPLDARPDRTAYLTDLVGTAPLTPSAPLAEGVADLLVQTALVSGDRGKRSWLTPSMEAWGVAGSGGRLVFRPGDTTLYEGGGIPLLLAAEAASGGPRAAELADLARAAVPEQLAVPDLHVPRGLSYFAGLPGVAALHHELGVLMSDESLLARRDELVAQVLACPPTAEHEVDLVGGVSATAAWLVDVGAAGAEDFLAAAGRRMRAALAAGELPVGELAHGDLGVAWCLARTAARLGDQAGLAQAAAVLTRHVADLETAAKPAGPPLLSRAAWCKGTAGSLVALAEALPLVGWLPAEVDRVISDLADRAEAQADGRGRDLSPCHGVTGIVAALDRAGRLRGRPDLTARAADLLTRRRERARTEGYVGGLAGSQGFLGFALGLTGAAHVEATLAQPHWGSPLWLTATRAAPARPTRGGAMS